MDVILIPGFWLDASSWDPVVPALAAAGHRMHPLTLPGRESPDAARTGITLRSEVDAAVRVIDSLDASLGPVALVGHSGGGAVAHAALDRRPARVARVVYVDSGPLPEGMPINDKLPVVDGEIPLPDWSVLGEEDLTDLDDDLRADFRRRAVPIPAGVATEPQAALVDPRRYDVPVTVIACGAPAAMYQEWMSEGVPLLSELARIKDVTWVDLPTGHWPQFTRPAELAEVLVQSVGAA